MQEYNYTIIIPHKNIPELLQRCLNSIPQRDDIQVVIVDDNSDPRKVDFDHFPGLNRPNTEVHFDKTGKGAGRARNVGLEHVKGKWVLFADADDWFTPAIGNILNSCPENSDVVYFNALSLDCQDYSLSGRVGHVNGMHEIYAEDKEKGEWLLKYLFGEPWCKIVKRRIIEEHGICFEETPIHNDTFFSYSVGLAVKKVAVNSNVGYVVTTRANSLSTTTSDEKVIARMGVFARKYVTLKKNGIELYEGFIPGTLKDVRGAGNTDLYKRCLDKLEEYGLSEEFALNTPTYSLSLGGSRYWMYQHAYEIAPYIPYIHDTENIYKLSKKNSRLYHAIIKFAGMLLKIG